MTQKKLFEILTLIQHVRSTTWKLINPIVESINDDKSTKVLEKEWMDHWKRESDLYPLNLDKIDTWSTYDECVDLEFYVEKNVEGSDQLICEASIWDGDMLDGERTKRRFTAKIKLANKFIRTIEENINWRFNNFLEDQYELHLEMKKEEWMKNLRQEILKDDKPIENKTIRKEPKQPIGGDLV